MSSQQHVLSPEALLLGGQWAVDVNSVALLWMPQGIANISAVI